LRPLDAVAEGVAWEEAARTLLHIDPSTNLSAQPPHRRQPVELT
jgi:hypothetical protein